MSKKAEIENSIAKKRAHLRSAHSADERRRIENDIKALRAASAEVDR